MLTVKLVYFSILIYLIFLLSPINLPPTPSFKVWEKKGGGKFCDLKLKTKGKMKHALTHTCLRYFSFLGDVCLLPLPGQVQLKKILVSHKVCTLLSKLIISMSFWSIYSRCYCSSGSFPRAVSSNSI